MPRLYDDNYPSGFIEVDHINAYLLPGPNIYVTPRATPFYRVPPVNIPTMAGVSNAPILMTL